MSDHEIPQSMIARVERCIEQAKEFERFGEEGSAQAAYARADAIITKHRIDRALINMSEKDKTRRDKPIRVDISFDFATDFASDLSNVLASILSHCDCKGVIREWKNQITIVGFEPDIEYAQMLWASVVLAFASKINPTWDPERPADENIKVLKEAGRKWQYIADFANKNGFECTANDGRLKAAYRRQCRLEGVEPTAHTQRNAAYRAAYAESFCVGIRARLCEMKRSADDVAAQGEPGTAVALRNRSQDVFDLYYELFPHLRPMSDEERAKRRAEYEEEQARLAEMLAAMTPKQRAAHEARQRREDARNRAQWEREAARRQDAAGSKAGRNAARSVDLGSNKVGTGRRGEIES